MEELKEDSELVQLVKNNNDNKALSELVERHSGIYIDMIKKFGYKSLSLTQINDILEDKEYNIYQAAISYDEKRSKFSTYLATKAKYICLTEKTKNKNKKPHFPYEDFDFFIESKDLNPEEFLFFNDSLDSILNLISTNKDKRVEKIFMERYFGGRMNKLQPWSKVGKKIGLSSQACINIHNKTIKQIKRIFKNETIKF